MNSSANQIKSVAIIAILLISHLQGVANAAAQSLSAGPSAEQTRILNATVQIRLVALLKQEAGSRTDDNLSAAEVQALLRQGKGYIEERGLGTAASLEGANLILTHNHWGQVLLGADLVEIRNASGELLAAWTGTEFLGQVRYSDAGTLVLETPAALSAAPARLGTAGPVKPGQAVYLVRQSAAAPGQVEVVPASVEGAGRYERVEVWTVKTSQSNAIIPGDSGGGVWLNGELIGNLWTSEGVYFPGLWGSAEKPIYTGHSRAAQLPKCDWSAYLADGVDKVDEKSAPQEAVKGAG